MNEKGTSIREAQKRSMNFQERFSFLLLIGKFLLSKFGLFFLFFILHLTASYQAKTLFSKLEPMKEQRSSSLGTSYSLNFPDNSRALISTLSKDIQKKEIFFNELHQVSPDQFSKFESNKLCPVESEYKIISQNRGSFQKIKYYCIIATIVTLFLNPQQTKYFGGLAVVLKQAGFFTKYGKSEKMVYIFSWIFVILFFYSSIDLSKIIRSLS